MGNLIVRDDDCFYALRFSEKDGSQTSLILSGHAHAEELHAAEQIWANAIDFFGTVPPPTVFTDIAITIHLRKSESNVGLSHDVLVAKQQAIYKIIHRMYRRCVARMATCTDCSHCGLLAKNNLQETG